MQDQPSTIAETEDPLLLTRTPLAATWQLRATAGPVPANVGGRDFDAPVPGDVHTALRAADAIPDPVDGDNEHRLSWIGHTDWRYATTVPALDPADAAHERVELVFHGVDTIARVEVDGEVRGRSRNMHRTWRVEIPESREADVELAVHLASPIAAAQAERDRLGARPSAFDPLPPYIRKKACDFGWDWGPALPGAGIWRPVEVEAWSTARLSAVRPTVRLIGDDGVVALDIDIERTNAGMSTALEIVASVDGSTVVIPVPAGADRVRGELAVPSPRRWWPAGLGEPWLYDLDVVLRTGASDLDHRRQAIGFRDLVVEQIDDEEGRSFGITVNGVALFVRGFNWIPDDTSISAVTADDYRRRVADARELGANLLRVWGGGVFESDEFYRACDEAGLLVWQDFLFACAAYPEEAPFTEEVEAEARDNVSRLMHHPSLAIWNGNNENLWFWFLHDWEDKLGGASWGEGFYFDVLPRVVADLDPGRTYLVGSPSSGDRWHAPNDPSRGVIHWWIPDDYRAYDEVKPRFVSEFGFQGPPARATFDAAVHDAEPAPFSPGVIQRQKAEGGTERINTVLDQHFGVPSDFDQWYWLAQLNQARAVRYGVERFRTLEPYCRGTIVWQLNDCWPALSWSVIDVADRWKPAAFAVREAYRDRIVVTRHEDGLPAVFACNSTSVAWDAMVRVQRWQHGQVSADETIRVAVPPHTALRVASAAVREALGPDEALIATVALDGERPSRSTLLGTIDRDFPDDEPAFSVSIRTGAAGVEVTVHAESLLRDLALLAEDIDPDSRVDVNLLTLLPGESQTWSVRTAEPGRFDEEAVRRVLRWARAATETDPEFRSLAMLEAEKAARAADAPS